MTPKALANVPCMTSILSITPRSSATPAPLFPYIPTA